MTKTIFILFGTIFLTIAALAQDFKVLSSQGNNVFQKTKQRIWAGTTLKTSDAITIAQGGYLGLMHTKTGKTIEVKKAGNYLMSNLVPKTTGSSLVAKYGSYVGEEMVKVEKQDINKNHRKYMAVTGAVNRERAIGVQKTITLLAQSEETIFHSTAIIQWLPDEAMPNAKYYVLVSNLEGEQVAWYETDQTALSVDFAYLKKGKSGKADFLVTVTSVQNPNLKNTINVSLLNSNEYDNIKKELGDFKPENALDYMLLAKFFEDKKLNLDALACYQKALALNNSEHYKTAYMEFLVRNKMGYTYEEEK